MKKILGGKGDINGAMAVGNEIKSLINADTNTEHSLKITKATYGSKRNSVNVTKNLTTQIKNNEIGIFRVVRVFRGKSFSMFSSQFFLDYFREFHSDSGDAFCNLFSTGLP